MGDSPVSSLSLLAGGLASYFMGRRMAKMKPADIMRRLLIRMVGI